MCNAERRTRATEVSSHSRAAAGLDGLDAGGERLAKDACADDSQHARKRPAPEVFALANYEDVDDGRSIGLAPEGVVVARGTAPQVGVGGGELDVVEIGPVVMQAFPDAARA